MSGGFLSLPREVRDRIYGWCFRGEVIAAVENDLIINYTYGCIEFPLEFFHRENVDVTWMLTSKQIHDEALHAFYQHARCIFFHVRNRRAWLVRHSPFRIARTKSFNFHIHLSIGEHKVTPDFGDYCEPQWKEIEDRIGIPMPPAGYIEPTSLQRDESRKEACQRFVKLLEASEKKAVRTLSVNIHFYQNWERADADEHMEIRDRDWFLKAVQFNFGFITAFGNTLDTVTLGIEQSAFADHDPPFYSQPYREGFIFRRHYIIHQMQKSFARMGKRMVTGPNSAGTKSGWHVEFGGDRFEDYESIDWRRLWRALQVKRAPPGEKSTSGDTWGLRQCLFIISGGGYYHRLPDEPDGKLRFEGVAKDVITVDTKRPWQHFRDENALEEGNEDDEDDEDGDGDGEDGDDGDGDSEGEEADDSDEDAENYLSDESDRFDGFDEDDEDDEDDRGNEKGRDKGDNADRREDSH